MRRWLALPLSVVLLASATAVAQQPAGPQKMDRPGIANYTKVDAVVACGGATETAALEGLKNDGFKSVINLRLASEPGANIEENAAHAKKLGLNYLHIPFDARSPDPNVFDAFLQAVGNETNQPAYVHCGSANRVGAVWLAKRVLQDGWPIGKATEEAKFIGLRSEALEQMALKYIESQKK